jgi:hypothetical protein
MAHTCNDSGDETAGNQGLQKRLAGTNINATTFLATDFLNHFNEIIMLIDLIPDMPECLEDAQSWQPKSYIKHFEDSSFSDKALAIEAYLAAPPAYREPLEQIVARLNDKIFRLLSEIERLVQTNRIDDCVALIKLSGHDFRLMIQLASSVINGTAGMEAADQVDALLVAEQSDHIDQDAIDRLF